MFVQIVRISLVYVHRIKLNLINRKYLTGNITGNQFSLSHVPN